MAGRGKGKEVALQTEVDSQEDWEEVIGKEGLTGTSHGVLPLDSDYESSAVAQCLDGIMFTDIPLSKVASILLL